ncbi:hypothetical protein EA187_02070 [Lujinxingia sediminis]|uniref:Uncharacterized protein n=1 Tax=Lujinxingia sediminis TaxID=2480984 RepID=A0ABY0CXA5_9DELT|nr:hypothetical protein [Lujinxingia sediminis]RVU48244.1 hypothetical protein EA187_02070 [Lujinxingia sediminis]
MSQEPKLARRSGAFRLSAVGALVGGAGLVASLWFGASAGMLVALAALGSFAGLVGLGRLSAAIATRDVQIGASLLVGAVILGSLLTLGAGAPGRLSTLGAMWAVQGAAWLAALAMLFVAAAAAGRAPQAVGALSAALGLGVLGVWAERARSGAMNFAWPLATDGEPLFWGLPAVRQAAELKVPVMMGAESAAGLVATASVVAGIAALVSSELVEPTHRLRALADKLWAGAAALFAVALGMVFGTSVPHAERLIDAGLKGRAAEWLSAQQLPPGLAEQGELLVSPEATAISVHLSAMGAEVVALLMAALLCAWAAWRVRRGTGEVAPEGAAAQETWSRGLVGRAVALMVLGWAWGLLVTWESGGAFGVFTRAEWVGFGVPLVVLGLHQAMFEQGTLGALARRVTPVVALAFVSLALLWVWSHGAAPGVGVSLF